MNVLIFNPPSPDGAKMNREGRCTQKASIWGTQRPPLTLATVAALLENDGHRVTVRDFPATGGTEEDLVALVRQERPDYAFWATGTPSLDVDLSWGAVIKKIFARTRTGVFGTHVTAVPETALSTAGVDCVIRREPELIIRNVCRSAFSDISRVKGVSYRDSAGVPVSNPDEDFLQPWEIPAPAWHLFPFLSYTLPLKRRPFLIVAPVRGCPFKCSFCTSSIYYGRALRRRPVDNVLDEIETNIKRHGITDFFIWADTFTADRNYVLSFCRGIHERNLDISWTCNSRVDTIDRELLAEMKKAGLWMMSFGIESGSDDILKRSGKGITTEQSRCAVVTAHSLGIRIAGHFIFGLPGETEETLRQTTDFALSLPLDIAQFYAAAPFPGTPFYAEAVKEEWLDSSGNLSQSSFTLQIPGLAPESVNRARQKAYLRFYSRPRTILRLLSFMGSLKNIFIRIPFF